MPQNTDWREKVWSACKTMVGGAAFSAM
jgi:hypothetical protein